MSKKIRPTLAEDMSLARNGGIRTEDGLIEQVGLKEAYVIIDQRKRSNFYNIPNVDLGEDVEKMEPPAEVEDEEGEINDERPEPIPEEPTGSNGHDSKEPESGQPEPEQPFKRGKVVLRKFTRKGYRRKSGGKSGSRKPSKSKSKQTKPST
jgi:hypothetical protein